MPTLPTWAKVVLGLAALAGIVVLVERLIVTDREAVQASTDRVRRAALDGDADAMLAEVADDYRHLDVTKAELATLARTYLDNGRVTRFGFLGRKIAVAQGRAHVDVDVVLEYEFKGRKTPARIMARVTYEERESGWKVVGFKVTN